MTNDTIIKMKEVYIQVRITKELQAKLQEISDREGLPVTKMVLTSLAQKYPELVDIILKH